MKKSSLTKKQGFTLIEAIVTIMILGIIAAIAIPAGISYMEKADQTARNKVARSVFLAAQKAFSSDTSSGIWQWKNAGNPLDKSSETFKEAESAEDLRYVCLARTESDKSSKVLYQMIEPYLADKSILDESLLIEFNSRTGRVYSAFYSEVQDEFGYGKGAEASGYNVDKRDMTQLKNGKVGFYGVGSMDVSNDAEINAEALVQLVDYDKYKGTKKGFDINGGNNYGLLTVECLLPENWHQVKEMRLILYGSGQETIVLKNGGSTTGSNELDLNQIAETESLEQAVTLASAAEAKTKFRRYPMYIEQHTADDGKMRDILVLLLDSQKKNLGIMDNHSSLGVAKLKAELKINYGTETINYVSNSPVHSLFASSQSNGEQMAYGIRSIRHLNNVRHTVMFDKYTYVQLADIYCRDFKDEVPFWTPIEQTTYIQGTQTQVNDKYIQGSLRGLQGKYLGDGYKIYDLTIGGNKTDFEKITLTGLFGCIAWCGTVDGVYIDYTEEYWNQYWKQSFDQPEGNNEYPFINGKDSVGAIAGENWGTISNCTVRGKIFSGIGYDVNKSEYRAGGIAGKNMYNRWLGTEKHNGGLITRCFVAADICVKGAASSDVFCAGGIVGDNYAWITYCEVGTASAMYAGTNTGEITVQNRGVLCGTPYFGAGILKQKNPDYPSSCQNDCYTISSDYAAGGIAGQHSGSEYGYDPKIQYCVNAASVEAVGCAGGLVGNLRNEYTKFVKKDYKYDDEPHTRFLVLDSYNAGSVICTGNGDKPQAGGIVGKYNSGVKPPKALFIQPVHKSIHIQPKDRYNKIESCYNTGPVYCPKGYASGISGPLNMYTELNDCYNAGSVIGKDKDGMFYDMYNCMEKRADVFDENATEKEFTIKIHNCAAIDKTWHRNDYKLYKYPFYNKEDRLFLSQDDLKIHDFAGMEKALDTLFDYPYPVNKIKSREMPYGFHRTPYTSYTKWY